MCLYIINILKSTYWRQNILYFILYISSRRDKRHPKLVHGNKKTKIQVVDTFTFVTRYIHRKFDIA